MAAMDRWPPYGGGREGRFDCIYITGIKRIVDLMDQSANRRERNVLFNITLKSFYLK